MKLILSLLSLIALANVCFAFKGYVNFMPSTNSKCTAHNGLGYSLLTDTCFSFDLTNSHIIRTDNGSLYWSRYQVENSQVSCDSQPIESAELDTTDCKKSTIQFNFDLNLYSNYYYQISYSAQPSILPNSYTNQYAINDCSSDNVVLEEYLTSGTSSGDATDVTNYICKNGVAFSQECIGGNCAPVTKDSENCQVLSYSVVNVTFVENYKTIYCTTN